MDSIPFEHGKKIEHPAAWRGKQLAERPSWGQSFPEDLLKAKQAKTEFDGQDADWFHSIQEELENGCGAVLIRGLEIVSAVEESSSDWFLRFCQQIGTPVSQSAKGEIVFSVRDEGYAKDDSRARGPNTRKKLSFHTDRCDVIAFLCLREAKEGGDNEVVSSMSLYNEMLTRRPDLLEILCQPFYYQRHNVDVGNSSPFTKQPIFSFHNGFFASNLLRVLIDRAYASDALPPMEPAQKEALDFLEELAADPQLHFGFRQQRGDILLLNNWVTYHRRTEFVDHEEKDKRRHLLRIWLSMPNSRPLDPMFAGNYGATGAGEIRGGMQAAK